MSQEKRSRLELHQIKIEKDELQQMNHQLQDQLKKVCEEKSDTQNKFDLLYNYLIILSQSQTLPGLHQLLQDINYPEKN